MFEQRQSSTQNKATQLKQGKSGGLRKMSSGKMNNSWDKYFWRWGLKQQPKNQRRGFASKVLQCKRRSEVSHGKKNQKLDT